MTKRQITIRDLAIKLNISISTVSRALRGSSEINPETKKAVLELAKKLNYEPNQIAQSLRNSRTNIIGIIVPEIVNYFFSTAISSIQESLSHEGYNIMICQSNEKFLTEVENVKTLINCRVDGVILSISRETDDFEHLKLLQNKNIPFVLFDRVCESLDVPKITVDDCNGGFQAVNHLIESGYSKIAHLAGPKKLQISNQRLQGYFKALNQHSLPLDYEYFVNCETLEQATDETLRLLDLPNPPDAIFTFNDSMAVSVLMVLKEKGFRVPEDIGLVGFTNDPVTRIVEPALTTINQPAAEMGKISSEMLIKMIRNKDTSNCQKIVLDTELVVRKSSGKSLRMLKVRY